MTTEAVKDSLTTEEQLEKIYGKPARSLSPEEERLQERVAQLEAEIADLRAQLLIARNLHQLKPFLPSRLYDPAEGIFHTASDRTEPIGKKVGNVLDPDYPRTMA